MRMTHQTATRIKLQLDRIIMNTPALACSLVLAGAFAEAQAQPLPHHFTGIIALADKTVGLSLDGSVSNMFNLTGTISNQFMQMFDLYPVEASTDLADWTRLALLLRTNNDPNPLLFQDPNAAGLNRRFYRTFTNYLITMFPNPSGPLPGPTPSW